MGFESKKTEPNWKKLSEEVKKLLTPDKVICKNPNQYDLFMNGVMILSRHPKYLLMRNTQDKYNCIQHLGLSLGIDCATAINCANTILSQTGGTYNNNKMLD